MLFHVGIPIAYDRLDSTRLIPSPLRFHFIEGAFPVYTSYQQNSPPPFPSLPKTIVGLLQLAIEIRVHSQEEEEQN